ncbi:hypothetical protein BpHYR1_020238 [Brachionus plicatilis]|uniref:Uncharacterized protein n=1 Tax=Brachionus plicatilis TaxID=10195 RepID=A0A3M7R4W2_BRAPC|nr:hypothetical protein BpHYR1_020238 [Brachionus plicatilis]
MGLSVSEREVFRKTVKNLISQMTKSDLVAHFTKQGIARSTIYNTINQILYGRGQSKARKIGHDGIFAFKLH